ncbi:MAG TPA: post-transcriptional regulator [Bacillaceae bacterium]|nr:post-transcriptional regulator [Paenibacillus bovis]HLU23860.1 post-transcriptional regulator [Bacillaceae bacterium]
MSNSSHPYNSYLHLLTPVIDSKLEEFTLTGYGKVNKQDLWGFLTKKKWQKPKEGIRIHELVADILSVKIGEFMNYATVEAYKAPNLFVELDSEELQELLGEKTVNE